MDVGSVFRCLLQTILPQVFLFQNKRSVKRKNSSFQKLKLRQLTNQLQKEVVTTRNKDRERLNE